MNAQELGQISVSPNEYAYGGHSNYIAKGGITMRQHFAGLAMQAMIAHETSCESTAMDAVAYADALLQELSREQ